MKIASSINHPSGSRLLPFIVTLLLIPRPSRGEAGGEVRKKMESLLSQKAIRPVSRSFGAPQMKMESHDVYSVTYNDKVLLLEPPRPGAVSRNIGVRRRERPVEQPKIDFDDISFRINSPELSLEATALLDQVAAVLNRQEYKGARLAVNGHTDRSTGSYQWNMELSSLRALSVIKYLVDFGGVDATRLEGHGYGPNVPKHDESTSWGIRKNRRVEFELVSN